MILRLLLLPLAASALIAPAGAEPSPNVRLNTLGFLPAHEKKASIDLPCRDFWVVRSSDGKRIFNGTTTGPVHNDDTDEMLYTADFSPVIEPGTYKLVVAGVGESAPFRIAPDVYRDAFVTVVRGMYLWRCGCAVRGERGGQVFAHGACHLDDGWLDFATGEHVRKDGTKGWHDAGDYNKYVVNAGVTVGSMLQAWKDFSASMTPIELGLPESDGPLPDFLAEVKWELEWLLTMQADDGAVYHKLSTRRFGAFVLPEEETEPRYFSPPGTAATADFVAMLASAARLYRPYDPGWAERCLAAVRKSYAYLQAHPEEQSPDLSKYLTGGYLTRDPDDRLWAAAELWETTGDPVALKDFEDRARGFEGEWLADFDWSEVRDLGFITYLQSRRAGRDPALVATLRTHLLALADGIVATRNAHGYGRPLGTRYYWGANGTVARQTLLLHAAHAASPKREYVETALDALGFLFGRNVHGRSYVTGLGRKPPLHPHDRRSGADDVAPPWPGYLVGGPCPGAKDWHDEQGDFRTNEIAINWNGALIYALAWFVGGGE